MKKYLLKLAVTAMPENLLNNYVHISSCQLWNEITSCVDFLRPRTRLTLFFLSLDPNRTCFNQIRRHWWAGFRRRFPTISNFSSWRRGQRGRAPLKALIGRVAKKFIGENGLHFFIIRAKIYDQLLSGFYDAKQGLICTFRTSPR